MTNQMRAARGRGLIAMSVAALVALAALVPGAGRAVVTVYDPGDIIVADSGHQAIKTVDPVSGAATPVSSGGSFVFPADVTFASDGDILVVDRDAFGGKGGIIRVDSATAMQTTVSSNAVSDAAGGKQLFSNPIALDRKQGSLFVTDFHRPQKVIKVDIATGKESLVSEGQKLHTPSGIVAADLARPLVSDADAGVIEINPKSGKQSVVSSGGKFKFPSAITLMGSNSALVVDPDTFQKPGAIFKVNLRNGDQKTLVRGGQLENPIGIALLDNHTAAVTDTAAPTFPAGGLYRVDLETGDQTLLNGTDFSNPLGIRIAP
jgi:hypothetical protein